ncbi:hypothetical protein TNCV_1287811 [Trichonephila clavipes]|nr:hypothetical protein TNCV_1287811 [Trichonephila clavipes]
MCSNKSSVLAISFKAITIHSIRSSVFATSVSFTNDFIWHQKKKFKGLRSGERAGQVTGLPRLIHFPECVICRWLFTRIDKCAGASLRMDPKFWCTLAGTPRSNSQRSEEFAYAQFS